MLHPDYYLKTSSGEPPKFDKFRLQQGEPDCSSAGLRGASMTLGVNYFRLGVVSIHKQG